MCHSTQTTDPDSLIGRTKPAALTERGASPNSAFSSILLGQSVALGEDDCHFRRVLGSPAGSSGAQEIAKILPAGAHVVKAFNTLFGHVLAKGGRLDAFIAADDLEAKARVSMFIESLGLRPMDVGGLHMAQSLEALGLMMIGLAKNGAGTWDIAMNVDIG